MIIFAVILINNIADSFKQYTDQDMAKKDKKDIKQVIADALEHYHKMKPSIKDSTKRQNESLLSEFYRFVDTLPARNRTMKIFSQ